MPFARSSPAGYLKNFALLLLKKMAFIAIAWIAVFFISHPFRRETELNILELFSPLIGAFSGLVAGWYVATDSVEESSLSGLTLWTPLVIAAVLPMWAMDYALCHFMHWPMNFSGFMLLAAASLLALAAAVWHASSQE